MDLGEIRILLVEDNPIDAAVLQEELSDSEIRFAITRVNYLTEAIKRLNEEIF